MNNERDQKIIEQAKSYLQELINSNRFETKIDEAVETNTLDAFWDLQKALHKGGEFTQRLVDYKGVSDALTYTNELAKILRGEYLNDK